MNNTISIIFYFMSSPAFLQSCNYFQYVSIIIPLLTVPSFNYSYLLATGNNEQKKRRKRRKDPYRTATRSTSIIEEIFLIDSSRILPESVAAV